MAAQLSSHRVHYEKSVVSLLFSNRFEKEKFEDYKTDLGTGNTITPDFTEADDFLKFIQKNRRSVPSKERIADKDKFIKTVYELSNSFEIDADLIEFAEGYIANIYGYGIPAY